MNTSYAYDTYRAHDLNIAMRTSSGDTVEIGLSNHQSASFSSEKNQNGMKTSMSFSSMQSFEFHVQSNGIDAQDQKEIDEFMKTAQPFIDKFLEELKNDVPASPVTQLASKIASIFEPSKERDENSRNNVKTNIVKMFDNSMKKLEVPEKTEEKNALEKIFKDAQKLLEKTLKEFDEFNKKLYA